MNTSEILNLTADYMEKFGVGTSWFPEYGEPGCLEGAGKAVCERIYGVHGVYDNWHLRAKKAVADYLTSTRPEFINPGTGKVIPFSWFDRTKGVEAIEVLRAAAVIEQARETERAKNEVRA